MDKDQQRRQRLQEWLSHNPPEWRDLKEEIGICLKNSEVQLKGKNCNNREFFAGECSGLEMILNFCEQHKIDGLREETDE